MGNNNEITLCGVIVSVPEFSHEIYGEKFFLIMVETQRLSGNLDTIPVIYSERLPKANTLKIDDEISVVGSIRTRNDHSSLSTKLKINVFAGEISINTEAKNDNYVLLHGFICKNSGLRKTPLGREISDILFACNRSYGKSDYIPCVVWGRNAKYMSELPVGTELDVVGRLQSRKYVKKHEDGTVEEKTAYELSVSKFEEKVEEE